MFLKFPRFSSLRTDESGSALAAVIGVVGVMLVVTTLVGSVTFNAIAITNTTKGGVQAHAVAEAGIDEATSILLHGGCPNGAGADLDYTVQVLTTTSATPTGFSGGCPNATTKYVMLRSTGRAAEVAGLAGQGKSIVESVFTWIPGTSSITGSGTAVYSYNSGVINDADLLQDATIPADVQIKTGSISCTSGTLIQGSIVLQGGNGTVENSCEVNGSLRASGSATVRGIVHGDVIAAGVGFASGDQTFTAADGRIDGNVASRGRITLDNSSVIGGSVISGPGAGTSTVNPNSRVGGSFTLAGDVSTWATRCPSPNNTWDAAGNACSLSQAGGKVVTGLVRTGITGIPAPTVPTVPNWTDIDFVPADWTSAGYAIQTWIGSCTVDNTAANKAFLNTMMTSVSPVVIDARACPKVLISSSAAYTFTLKTDIAIVAKGFGLENATIRSDSSTPRQMRFFVPDVTPNGIPTCSGPTFDINSGVRVQTPAAALIYTPCQVKNSTNKWRGQFYAGSVAFDSASGLTASPIGMPGYDFTTGAPSAPGPGGTLGNLGDRISLRDYTP
ncbi:hypothetical protein ASF62_07485 [Leifsonia sp. Leaf325]|nr:polymer-forming cytoskeletal protein [Leifsonia sp. Leaf325]KQQ94000.1 hypothetical protein ASF62_07485 [Leifsonia sp. Leaf325]